jgi:hypothetical protein
VLDALEGRAKSADFMARVVGHLGDQGSPVNVAKSTKLIQYLARAVDFNGAMRKLELEPSSDCEMARENGMAEPRRKRGAAQQCINQ